MNTPTKPGSFFRFGLHCLSVLAFIAALGMIPSAQARNSNAHISDRAVVEALHVERVTNAQVITVTNATDDVNGDTSSVPALIASPGPDGISFREALEASNNTPGAETIEFAPTMTGDSIYILSENNNWPILTGGDLTINGDIDRDGAPDITLDGTLGSPDSPSSNALSVWSDDNTISGLAFKHFSGTAILFGAPGFYTGTARTISGNTIISNTIENSVISVSPFGWVDFSNPSQVSNLTWQDTVIAGNHLTSTMELIGGINLIAAGRTADNNRILNATVANNTLTGFEVAIMVIAADTNSYWGGLPGPIQYADNNLIQGVEVSSNVIETVEYKGIEVVAGNMGNSGNQVLDVTVRDNHISGRVETHYHHGITIVSAIEGDVSDQMTANNLIDGVDVSGNTIEDAVHGVFARASDTNYTMQSPGFSGNRLENLIITDNVMLRSSSSGISVWGAWSNQDFLNYDNTIKNVTIQGNQVLASATPWWASGIWVVGGMSESACPACVSGNVVEDISVLDNEVVGFKSGVHVAGGLGGGAVYNRVSGIVLGNQCMDNTWPYNLVADEDGAADNQIDIEMYLYTYLSFIAHNVVP